LGIRGASTCEVVLEAVPVPAENVLGQVGQGHVVALNVLNAGRLKLAAGLLGPARDLVRLSTTHALARHTVCGPPIAESGLLRQKLGRQPLHLSAAQSAVYRVAGAVSVEGGYPLSTLTARLEDHLVECAMMKVLASEMIDAVVDEAVQIHGG